MGGSINNPENFAGRVNLAALYISRGRPTTRAFDSCFENDDGAAVTVALYRRSQKNPGGLLASNIWRYLARDSVESVATEHAHITNMTAWARELRRAAQEARK